MATDHNDKYMAKKNNSQVMVIANMIGFLKSIYWLHTFLSKTLIHHHISAPESQEKYIANPRRG